MKTIKERAMQLLKSQTDEETVYDAFALLQEIAHAPEPEPVARVTGYHNGYLSIATTDGRVLPSGTALYLGEPPANNQSEQPLEMVNLPELKEGEIYAGIMLNSDGAPSHHLILLPGDNDDANWDDQTEWAKSIGGKLPTRAEQSLLFANCKQHLQGSWYWSGETVSSEPGWAWSQYLDGGDQDYDRKTNELRARAVCRVEIK